jgi:hypothetical protein
MRFYFCKIGEHLQKLAMLAIVVVPLDRHLTIDQTVVSWVVFSVIGLVGFKLNGGRANGRLWNIRLLSCGSAGGGGCRLSLGSSERNYCGLIGSVTVLSGDQL